ncbi:phosphatase [Lacimicrobium alkaliphilum]|uniref:Phosphatase n=2 Tax=Lacimicrobium alkaliphilum TaxID=1526571 RepID=A0ABQ1RKH5_9ALTE|nr:phosphatase [Lacimicrobium alkaliphilum]
MQKQDSPSFSLAVIADCQYADKNDNGARLYRRCPAKLREAVEDINQQQVKGTLHLGDFIDQDYQSFEVLNRITAKSRVPFYHVLGNHDFAVEDRYKNDITTALNMPARHYSFDIDDWRFIALDGNDVSHHGWPGSSDRHQQNMQLIRDKYADKATWNGAVGKEQLRWLKATLEQATGESKKVVILSHFPVYPEDPHRLWNHQEVLALVGDYAIVKAWFNGHNHKGDYGKKHGIHFVTFHGMLDTEDTAYSIVEFHPQSILIKGRGRQPDMQLPLN